MTLILVRNIEPFLVTDQTSYYLKLSTLLSYKTILIYFFRSTEQIKFPTELI